MIISIKNISALRAAGYKKNPHFMDGEQKERSKGRPVRDSYYRIIGAGGFPRFHIQEIATERNHHHEIHCDTYYDHGIGDGPWVEKEIARIGLIELREKIRAQVETYENLREKYSKKYEQGTTVRSDQVAAREALGGLQTEQNGQAAAGPAVSGERGPRANQPAQEGAGRLLPQDKGTARFCIDKGSYWAEHISRWISGLFMLSLRKAKVRDAGPEK